MTKSARPSVLVIGGGMAGLTAASSLHARGINVLLLEASPRLGGRVESLTTGLHSRLDLGGQWVGAGHHRLRLAAAQAQATVFKTHSNGLPTLIYQNKKLSLVNPSVALVGIVLVLFDLLCRLGAPRSWNTVSIEKAIRVVSPTARARRLLEVIVTLSSTAELSRSSIYAIAQAVPLSGGLATMLGSHGGAQDSLVTESIGAVVEMLAEQLGPERVRTGMRVVRVEQTDGGVTVRVESGEEITADRVIITIPPPMLRSVSFVPPLPPGRMRLQETTEMGTVYKAIAVFETPFWRAHGGGEYLILDNPPRGISDASAPSGPGHLCILVGGPPARSLDELSPQARLELLLGPLVPVLGAEILRPLEWHEKAWHQDQFCGGGYMALPVKGSVEGFLPMPHEQVGRLHWAGTETAQEHPGYIEGAMQSGERAAEEVITNLCM